MAGLVAGCTEPLTPTAPSTAPVTETFASQFGIQGSASRTFVVPAAGTVSVTLASAGPPTDVVVGVGLGIPRPSGNGCLLNQSVTTAASPAPQLAAAVDAGTYCVRVYDVGNLTGDVSFSLSVLHP
jgi:hypothetical protein